MTRKIFLILVIFLIFSFCLGDNAQAADSCSAIGGDCSMSEVQCTSSSVGGKVVSNICPTSDTYYVCCIIKTCAENGYSCESASTTCAKSGTGSCPSVDKPKCCDGFFGPASCGGSTDEGLCRSSCLSGEQSIVDTSKGCKTGELCCAPSKGGTGTGTDFTETECKGFGGYCYKWMMDDYDNCPKGETQLGDCDSKNQIYCCQAAGTGTGTGNKIVPTQLAGLPTNPNLVKGIFENIANWLLSIIGIIALIGFVISGFQYYLVATDEKMMETAKKTMTASIIGLVIALSGFIVIYTIDAVLNARL